MKPENAETDSSHRLLHTHTQTNKTLYELSTCQCCLLYIQYERPAWLVSIHRLVHTFYIETSFRLSGRKNSSVVQLRRPRRIFKKWVKRVPLGSYPVCILQEWMCGSACWSLACFSVCPCAFLSICVCVWSGCSAYIPSCFSGSVLTLLVYLLFLTTAALTVIYTHAHTRTSTRTSSLPGHRGIKSLPHTHTNIFLFLMIGGETR